MTTPERLLDRALAGVALLLFAAIFTIVLAQVFFRYVLDQPLIWSEELARYLFVWLCFTGWVIASRAGDHILITALRDRVPCLRRWMPVVAELAHLLLAALLLRYGYEMVLRNLRVATVTLFFPFAVVYAVVPVAAALIAWTAIREIVVRLREMRT